VIPNHSGYVKVRRRKRKMPRYMKFILGLLGVYLLFSFAIGGYNIWQIKNEIAEYNLQKEELLKEQQQLENELVFLQEPEMIEKLARESLGMVKPGEILVVPAVPGEHLPKPKNIPQQDLLH